MYIGGPTADPLQPSFLPDPAEDQLAPNHKPKVDPDNPGSLAPSEDVTLIILLAPDDVDRHGGGCVLSHS